MSDAHCYDEATLEVSRAAGVACVFQIRNPEAHPQQLTNTLRNEDSVPFVSHE
jgi:hypothetical protein